MDFKDLSEAIKVLENYKIDLMFCEIGEQMDKTFFAVHHYLAAISQIDVAIQSLKLAERWSAREDGDRRRRLSRQALEKDRRRSES